MDTYLTKQGASSYLAVVCVVHPLEPVELFGTSATILWLFKA
jgi:hypothetical protein